MKQMFFSISLGFSMVQEMLAIWPLVPLPFLNPAWTLEVHGSSIVEVLLREFENYFASMCGEYNCVVVWAFFGIAFFGIGMKTELSLPCGHCWLFHTCWHIECSTFTTSSFRIWNSSTGIPSPPLALFVVMLSKACRKLHSTQGGRSTGGEKLGEKVGRYSGQKKEQTLKA